MGISFKFIKINYRKDIFYNYDKYLDLRGNFSEINFLQSYLFYKVLFIWINNIKLINDLII